MRSSRCEAVLAAAFIANPNRTSAILRNVKPAELDAKTHQLLMIRYAPNGYRLWNKNAKQIVIAPDVKFKEQEAP